MNALNVGLLILCMLAVAQSVRYSVILSKAHRREDHLVAELRRLQAEIDGLTSRSCETCTHGDMHHVEFYGKRGVSRDAILDEIGVFCNRGGVLNRSVHSRDFYCSKWAER